MVTPAGGVDALGGNDIDGFIVGRRTALTVLDASNLVYVIHRPRAPLGRTLGTHRVTPAWLCIAAQMDSGPTRSGPVRVHTGPRLADIS